MSRGDPMMRARDADREQVIAALDDAYADGQLSGADRELRVNRALEARTLGDLSVLTRDLQAPVLTPASPQPQRGRVVALAIAGLVTVVTVGTMVSVVMRAGGSDEQTAVHRVEQPPAQVEAPVDAGEPVDVEAEPAHRPLSKPWFRSFIDDYREEFGDARIWDASFREDGSVDFQRNHGPVRKNRMAHWDWSAEGGFTSTGRVDTNPFDLLPLELTDVALGPLMSNIKQGLKYLGVENPQLRVMLEHDANTQTTPAAVVRVDNTYGEWGERGTTLAGELIYSNPHTPDTR